MLVRDAGRLVQSLGDPNSAQSEKVNIWMLEDLDWRALSRCGRSHLTWLESLKGEMRGGRSTFIDPEKVNKWRTHKQTMEGKLRKQN